MKTLALYTAILLTATVTLTSNRRTAMLTLISLAVAVMTTIALAMQIAEEDRQARR